MQLKKTWNVQSQPALIIITIYKQACVWCSEILLHNSPLSQTCKLKWFIFHFFVSDIHINDNRTDYRGGGGHRLRTSCHLLLLLLLLLLLMTTLLCAMCKRAMFIFTVCTPNRALLKHQLIVCFNSGLH